VLASVFRFFLTPVGLPILAALDSSVVFFFPLGLDLALVLMTARRPELAWLYPLLALAGSLAGGAATFWIGRKLGEHGLERFVNARRLDVIKRRMGHGAAVSTGVLALIPPPFPFTAFLLAAGAFDVSRPRFFLTFGATRLLRYAVTSWLAVIYGAQIVRWMTSDTFEIIVGAFIAVAIAGTAWSTWRVVRSSRGARRA
jgi:membrane protein YqaA with SNARE-associated domain